MAGGPLVCCALAALALPIRARAEFLGRAAATAQFESNSNVFDLDPSGNTVTSPTRYSRPPSDQYYAYGAELTGIYVFGRQNIYARVVAKEFNYQRFTQLDHNEYEIVTRWLYKFGSDLEGVVGVTRTRGMVPFLDLGGSQQLTLSVVTQQRENVNFDYKLSPRWTLQGKTGIGTSSEPVANSPDLELKENTYSTTLKYVGIGRLTSGVSAGYGTGRYSGSTTANNPSFSQSQAGLVASFVSPRTIYDGELGYSRRSSSAGTDSTAGVTGLIDFTYRLTPKTAYRLAVSRSIKSYVVNSASELDTDFSAGLGWKATVKLSLALDYTFSYRQYPGQGVEAGTNRTDHRQQANLGIVYTPQPWVLIRPYANIQTSHSNLTTRDSNSTVFGISITVMTSDEANKASVGMESHWR